MLKSVALSAVLSALSFSAFAANTYNVDGKTVTAIKRCGMEWKATKPHSDIMWPQYWSACAKSLKANAQEGGKAIGKMTIDTKSVVTAQSKPIEVAK